MCGHQWGQVSLASQAEYLHHRVSPSELGDWVARTGQVPLRRPTNGTLVGAPPLVQVAAGRPAARPGLH